MQQQEQLAIEAHSQKATWFDDEYHKGDPYSDCFTYSRHRLDQVLANVLPDPASGARLLDVGCGTGEHMKRYSSMGFEVSGIDGSGEMLKIARKNNPEVRLQYSTVDNIPFADGSFDVLLCIEVLRYLPDVNPCVREMSRVTRPGGVCIATAQPYLNANGYWIVNRFANAMQAKHVSSLKQFFVWPVSLAASFRRAGFGRVEIFSVYTGPVNWWERLAKPYISGILRRWEKVDAAMCRWPLTKPFANMLVVRATR